jgi:hypothetical protein
MRDLSRKDPVKRTVFPALSTMLFRVDRSFIIPASGRWHVLDRGLSRNYVFAWRCRISFWEFPLRYLNVRLLTERSLCKISTLGVAWLGTLRNDTFSFKIY